MVSASSRGGRVAGRTDRPRAASARIRPGDRVAIIGRSGTGKTTLLKRLLAEHPRGLALDPKRRLTLPGWEPLEGSAAVLAGWPTGWPRVVARPGLVEDALDWMDACCRRIYQVGAAAAAVDELAGIVTGSKTSTWLDVLQTRGRESGITTYIGTQRPRRIPSTVISEAEHVFCFDLNLPADRDYLADVLGAWWRPASPHGFLYWRPGYERPVECVPVGT